MYKLTLIIYIDEKKPIEINESSKQLDTMILQNNVTQIILLKLKENNIKSDLVYTQLIKEKDGEHYDIDEIWVKPNSNYSDLEMYY